MTIKRPYTKTDLINKSEKSIESLLSFFDELESVNTEELIGQWKGKEIQTGHRMNGLLENLNWYGKTFISEEIVHPLVFRSFSGHTQYSVNPQLIPLSINFPKNRFSRLLFNLVKPFIKTNKSCARLRMVEYRNAITCTMIYDSKPINDHFKKIDNQTLLGLMDMKNEDPFFFLLEKESMQL